jgi:hypothetical protein
LPEKRCGENRKRKSIVENSTGNFPTVPGAFVPVLAKQSNRYGRLSNCAGLRFDMRSISSLLNPFDCKAARN